MITVPVYSLYISYILKIVTLRLVWSIDNLESIETRIQGKALGLSLLGNPALLIDRPCLHPHK
jgi:hypothetical protein